VYDAHWDVLAGKVPLSPQDLCEAKNLALELLERLGAAEREERMGRAPAPTSLLRQKAFTLLVRSYEAARRAVAYVRAPHGDAAQIAPSLFALRTRKRAAARAREVSRSRAAAEAAAGAGAARHQSLAAVPVLP
jgi:hypothetical protein